MNLAQYNNNIVYLFGGSTGIGRSIAQTLCSAGAHVIIFARKESSLIEALALLEAKRLNAEQRIEYRCLDVSDNNRIQVLMAELVLSFGIPDLLINCAGRAIPRKFEEISYEQFDETMKINLYGCRNTIAALLPHMKKQGGVIVNTSSIAGIMGVFGYSDYSASKFALIGFSEALKSEVRQYNIKVSVLCPPDTDTPGFENENLTKPAETIAISEGGGLLSPDQVAVVFFKELDKGKFLIIPGTTSKLSVWVKRLFPGFIDYFMNKQIDAVAKRS